MENRRKVLFIDKKFQLNVMAKAFGFFCFLYIAFVFVTYLLIYPLLTELSFLNLPPDHNITMIIQNFKFFAFWIVLLSFLGLSCFVIMATLLITHKVAGPIYSIKRTIREIIMNEELKEARFRKKDYFMDLKEHFNQLIEYVKKK